jgi:uncharacterized protein (DUF362 family)
MKGDSSLKELVEAIGLSKLPKGSRVLVKPNLRAAGYESCRDGSITRPALVKGLAMLLLNMGFDVVVGEGSSSRIITERALERTGMKELEGDGVIVLNLNLEERRRVEVRGSKLGWISIPKAVLDCDCIISLPVMKTHYMTTLSLSLKNMMGVMVETEANRMHVYGVHQSIADINTVVKPDLAIIDGTWAMDGFGPVYGDAKYPSLLIGGDDPLAVDVAGARVMGIDPRRVKHLLLAGMRGIGDFNPEIIGEYQPLQFRMPTEAKRKDFFDFFLESRIYNLLMSFKGLHQIAYEKLYNTSKSIIDYFQG